MDENMKKIRILLFLSLVTILSGCVTPLTQQNSYTPVEKIHELPFYTTSKQDVINALGAPVYIDDKEDVYMYDSARNKTTALVFDENDMLIKMLTVTK